LPPIGIIDVTGLMGALAVASTMMASRFPNVLLGTLRPAQY
jgi:hypothetical protein